MNLTEVTKSLDKLFAATPKQGAARNIVFWYDDEGAFADNVDSLGLANAKAVKLYDNNQLAVKLLIEREDTQSNLLVYSPMPRPADRDNWLADTLRYSQTFATDEDSLILINYKMDASLRLVAREYKAFFHNNDRVRRFDGYGFTDWTEDKLDAAALSALCKLNVPNIDACIRVILNDAINGDGSTIESIAKFGSMNRLWAIIKRNYGYAFEEREFERLAVLLLVTHFAHSFIPALPKAWDDYNAHNTSCFVLVDGFMKDASDKANYKELCNFVAGKIDLTAYVAKWDIADILECDTFPQFDEAIIGRIRGNILSGAGEFGEYKKMINGRRNRRWFDEYKNEYESLYYACELLLLLEKRRTFPPLTLRLSGTSTKTNTTVLTTTTANSRPPLTHYRYKKIGVSLRIKWKKPTRMGSYQNCR